MSDDEKLMEAGMKNPVQPLILRPQVGRELFHSRSARGLCWPQSVVLRVMFICVLLFTIIGCVLIIFSLHQHFNRIEAIGFCRALTSYPGVDVQERYVYEPNAITLVRAPVAEFPTAVIFHLLKDAVTIMRTHGVCYVYPLIPEVAEAIPVDSTIVERMQDSADAGPIQFKSPLGQRLLMLSPESDENVKINHQAAAANCSGLPIFNLIEMALSQASVQLNQNTGTAMSPKICSKECPLGESRDSLGVSRQVCRCPPKDQPPMNFVANQYSPEMPPVFDPRVDEGDDTDSDLDDDEVIDIEALKEGDQIDDPFLNVRSFTHDNPNTWLLSDYSPRLNRNPRAVENLHNPKLPAEIPPNCHVVDNILEGAIPNGRTHVLPLLTIVKC